LAPQPLSRVKRDASFHWGTGVLTPYPHLCCIITETISFGSQVEFNWSAILVHLLQSDARTGMAMYEALSGGEGRRAALEGAAKVALSIEDFRLFKAVEKALAPARNVRNRFAHHVWGATDEIPDALLLIDPQCLRQLELEQAFGLRTPPDENRSLIIVWKERDLIAARDSNQESCVILGILGDALAAQSIKRPYIDEVSRQKLISYPAIAQALAKLTKQQKAETPNKLS